VAGYRRTDKNRDKDIRQELNIFILREKLKEYQRNCLEHPLRMPTYRIPQKLSDYRLKKMSTAKEIKEKRNRTSEQVKSPKPCNY
jgi:hypothetical protein